MVTETRDRNLTVVRPIGTIDLSNVDELDAALDRAIRASPKGFVVDLTQMDYLDSAGLASMLAAYQRLSQTGGRLSVATGANSIRNLFDLLGLSILPELYLRDSLESAEQALLDHMERPT